MKNNISLKIILSLVIFSMLLPFFTETTEAASTETAFVNIKSGTLTVRSTASIKAKKVGSLKKDVRVVVYSKTKSGWSEIRYKKKKAYVQSKYLQISYLLDKSKVYREGDYIEGDVLTYKYKRKENSWDVWEVSSERFDKWEYVIKENSSGLYRRIDGISYLVLKYPLKVGQSWKNGSDTLTITSINKSLKTPAKTFKNVVEVKSTSSFPSHTYYAPSVGYISGKENGEAIYELIKISKR